MRTQALGHEGGSQQRGTELVVPEEDARGLAAYLELFAQIFREASLADVEAWTSELEGLVNVRPLWELFLPADVPFRAPGDARAQLWCAQYFRLTILGFRGVTDGGQHWSSVGGLESRAPQVDATSCNVIKSALLIAARCRHLK